MGAESVRRLRYAVARSFCFTASFQFAAAFQFTASGRWRDAYANIQENRGSFNQQSGVAVQTTTDTGGGQNITTLANGDWVLYQNVNFGTTAGAQFLGRVASGAAGGVSGLVEVRLDSAASAPIGSFAVANTGGWQSWTTVPANIAPTTGTHNVYITFTSGQPADFVNVNWIRFGH